MMSIEMSFIKNFEADVHLAYQQTGTKLRSTIRTKSGIANGSSHSAYYGKSSGHRAHAAKGEKRVGGRTS